MDSFGWKGGWLNEDFAGVGFTGLDDISLFSTSAPAFGLIIAGLVTLVILNANAWKSTEGGY